MAEVTIEAAKRGITSQDLLAMPERDGWLYEGIQPRDGEAYVCSSYMVAVFKAAGLFGSTEVHATEFTPRDLYELNFFDKNFRSDNSDCKKQGLDQPYCQIMGKYKMEFPRYGTVSPYENMNEVCSMISPMYERQEKC